MHARSAGGVMSLFNMNFTSQAAAISNYIGTSAAASTINVDAYAFVTTGAGKVTVKAYDDVTGEAVWILSGATPKDTLSIATAKTTATVEYDAAGVETIWILPARATVWIEEIKFVPTSASTTTKTLTIGSAGYATFSASENYTWNTSTYPSLKAYYVSAVSDGSATLKEITAANGIPAGTGVIFKGDAGNYTLTSVESATALASTNYLRANIADYTLKADNHYDYTDNTRAATTWNYTLAAGPTFKHSTGSGTLAAGKAFLRTTVNVTSAARSLNLVFDDGDDETTGISASLMNNEQFIMKNDVYDLQGRKVSEPKKGLYIVNGRKVFIK